MKVRPKDFLLAAVCAVIVYGLATLLMAQNQLKTLARTTISQSELSLSTPQVEAQAITEAENKEEATNKEIASENPKPQQKPQEQAPQETDKEKVEPEVEPVLEEQTTIPIDERINTLRSFLVSKKSPLANNAETFIKVADEKGLDYRLLPAITGIESSFGIHLLQKSYNPFGWGGGRIYFSSFDDGIEKVGEGLKKNYIDRGAESVAEIAPIYCPPNAVKWAGSVHSIMEQIEKTR